jgi:predicted XRE-type DNA-binding protein
MKTGKRAQRDAQVEEFEARDLGPDIRAAGSGRLIRKNQPAIAVGSGNVFADIGLANPELALAKAQLWSRILSAIAEDGLSQAEVAKRLRLGRNKVAALTSGKLQAFSTPRLLRYLKLLGYDIEVRLLRRRDGGAGKLRIR